METSPIPVLHGHKPMHLLGVIGHPIAHSLSPRMHNAALRHHGINAVYLAFDVLPEHLLVTVEAMRVLGLRGLNVTVPHKVAVLPLLDEVESVAARVGAVNTIVRRGERLLGYNTDVVGFRLALRAIMPEGATGLPCLVLGAGGAARAVVAGLVEEGAAQVGIFNRTLERATLLAEAAASWGSTRCLVVDAGDLLEVARSADVIVNATSVGMHGTFKETPLPVDILDSHHVVLDVVYGGEPTALVAGAQARGARAADGREMLIRQAAAAYELWFTRPAPLAVMRRAVEQAERRGPVDAGRARGKAGAQASR